MAFGLSRDTARLGEEDAGRGAAPDQGGAGAGEEAGPRQQGGRQRHRAHPLLPDHQLRRPREILTRQEVQRQEAERGDTE